jgi:hypothetical protein
MGFMRELRTLHLSLVGETRGVVPDLVEQKKVLAKLFKEKQRSCGYCGHFSPILRALEIDHLDGNHANFTDDNLELACHWCHAARHLEFSLRAGATLVLWNYPQVGVSRLTLQALQTTYLRGIYGDLIKEGEHCREHNFPDGNLAEIDLKLRAQMGRGDFAGAQRILNEIEGSGVRLAFPETYLSKQQPIPAEFNREEWGAICGYYERLKTNVLIDNDRRATLATRRKELQRGQTSA